MFDVEVPCWSCLYSSYSSYSCWNWKVKGKILVELSFLVIESKKTNDFVHFLCCLPLIPLEIVWYALLLQDYKRASSLKDFLVLFHGKSCKVMIYFSCTLTHLTSSCWFWWDALYVLILLLQEILEKISWLLLSAFIPFLSEERPFCSVKLENCICFWHYAQFYLTLLPV